MSKRVLAAPALGAIVLLVGSACSRAAKEVQPRDAGGQRAVHAPEPAVAGAKGRVVDERLATSGLPEVPPLPAGSKVIRNAGIEIRVGKGRFDDRFSEAGRLAESLGGFVAHSSTSSRKGNVASGTITVRVPSDKFQVALSSLRRLGKVTSEQQDGQDVTKEFVDLEARLRHAKGQEAFFLRLMDQAKTISDMIQIQEQLTQVQLRIEEIQGQLQFLRDQTSFATITAHIFEPGAAVRPGGLARAWSEAVAGFKAVLAGMIVAVGWTAPFVLLGLALVGAWKITRPKPAA